MGDFKLQVTEHRGIPVIGVSGDLDLCTASRLRTAADSLLKRGHRQLVFNLDDTSFIDSSGVAALIAVKKRPETGGIGVVASKGPAQRLLVRLALSSFLGLHSSTEDAVEHLQAESHAVLRDRID